MIGATSLVAQSFASLPSPSSGKLGPFNAYGLMIALAIITGIWLFGKRLVRMGIGTADDASYVGVWGAFGGVIGSRLYHVATEWESFSGDLGRIFQIWKGGLGIPGGLLLGIPVGIWAAKRRGLPIGLTVTAVAPAIPLAQAIGRIGNWFNQELFGRPTDLPWALEIDADVPVARNYPPGTTFHPTFLYEALGNLGICAFLLWLERRIKLKPGRLIAAYLAAYAVLRFFVEGLRIDPAKEGGGLRLNQWMAIVVFTGALAFLLWSRTRPWPATTEATDDDDTAELSAADLDDTGEMSTSDVDEPDGDGPQPTADTVGDAGQEFSADDAEAAANAGGGETPSRTDDPG